MPFSACCESSVRSLFASRCNPAERPWYRNYAQPRRISSSRRVRRKCRSNHHAPLGSDRPKDVRTRRSPRRTLLLEDAVLERTSTRVRPTCTLPRQKKNTRTFNLTSPCSGVRFAHQQRRRRQRRLDPSSPLARLLLLSRKGRNVRAGHHRARRARRRRVSRRGVPRLIRRSGRGRGGVSGDGGGREPRRVGSGGGREPTEELVLPFGGGHRRCRHV